MKYTFADYDDGFFFNMPGLLITVPFSASQTSALSQSFKKDIVRNLATNADCFYEMSFVNIGLTLWKNAFEQASIDSGENIPPLNYLRINLIGQEMDDASGSVSVEESLNVKRNMYIFEVNDNSQYLQVYPLQGSEAVIEPKPYVTDLPDNCKYGKQNWNFKYSSEILTISYILMGLAILLSLSALIFTIIKRNKSIITSFGKAYSLSLSIQLMITSLSMFYFISYPQPSGGLCYWRICYVGFCFKGIMGIFYAKCTKIFLRYSKTRRTIIKVYYFTL